ncbi:MAG: hypothetical protein MHPSP_002187, partial [Paramarteilia canceri]
ELNRCTCRIFTMSDIADSFSARKFFNYRCLDDSDDIALLTIFITLSANSFPFGIPIFADIFFWRIMHFNERTYQFTGFNSADKPFIRQAIDATSSVVTD